jgi:hypothetical protein
VSRHAAQRPVQDQARAAHVAAAGVAVAVAVLALALPGLGAGWQASVIVVIQAALVWAWVAGTATPGPVGGLLLGLASAATADTLVLVGNGTGVSPLLVVFGLLFPLLLVHQLTRGVVRTRLTESLSGLAAECVAVTALACYLELQQSSRPVAAAALLAATLGLLAGRLMDIVRPVQAFAAGVFHGVAGVFAAAVVGAGTALLRLHPGHLPVPTTVLLGAGLGGTVGVMAVGAAYITQTVQPLRTAFAPATLPVLRVLFPLAVTAPVAYLLGLVVIR